MVTFSGLFYQKNLPSNKHNKQLGSKMHSNVQYYIQDFQLFIAVYYLKMTRIWDYNDLYHGAKVLKSELW